MSPIDRMRDAAVRTQADVLLDLLPWQPEPIRAHLPLFVLGCAFILAGIIGKVIA